MAQMVLTKTRLVAGVWEGILTGAGTTPPALALRHRDEITPGIEVVVDPHGEGWVVRAPIPFDRVSDGLQTFVITDEASDEPLASFAVVAGSDLEQDLRADMEMMRAELDMLKRAFRRHCVETA